MDGDDRRQAGLRVTHKGNELVVIEVRMLEDHHDIKTL